MHFDGYLAVAHALDRAMLVAAKIAADLRLLSSGPVGGLGEVVLPALQPGSSAMPGKVNPVVPELVLQVSYDVRGTVTTVEAAVAGGELELNVMEPVIARRLLEALDDVASVTRVFADRCIDGLAWDEAALARGLRGSLGDAVGRAAEAGYETAVRERLEERRP
jgi:aspartate ammonia-lyase